MISISDVEHFYNNSDMISTTKHKMLYTTFESNVTNFNNGLLRKQFDETNGFGELAFSWNWYLLVKDMPINFKFLEIGVYKGRVLSLIQLLSDLLNKQVQITGVSPLNSSGDKYSGYDDIDYLDEIKRSFSISNVSFNNTQLIKGYSQNEDIINEVSQEKEYDIVFIDGCHDYEIVCVDIQNYSKMLKIGGYLVLDDASLLVEGAYGQFLGHFDVGKAIKDIIDSDSNFLHIYAVGHNRVWRKVA